MRRYSFLDTVMLVNGVEITGWAEGDDVIKIARRADSVSDSMGAAGDMLVSVSADRSGELSFTLQITSPSNKYLNDLMQRQEAAGSNFVPVNTMFQDMYRQDLANGTIGYLKRPADMSRGAKAGNQEWTIVVERLDMAFGVVPQDSGVAIGVSIG